MNLFIQTGGTASIQFSYDRAAACPRSGGVLEGKRTIPGYSNPSGTQNVKRRPAVPPLTDARLLAVPS
jgi:hypothetical protein